MTRTRDEIELDLPFFVNGTLDAETRAEVEDWLARDGGLQAEAGALAAIRERMQAEDVRSPGEFGLARLMRDVDRAGGRQQTAGPLYQKPWVWQVAAAVAVAFALGQALLPNASQPERFEVAGAPSVMMASATLTVAFQPDATEAQIRALLLDNGAEIVGGPSALGLYQLSVTDPADADAVAEALRAAGTIVESVANADP